jgi:hypothetical protein
MAEDSILLSRHVVFSGAHMQLEYSGPAPNVLAQSAKPHVVVAFAPFDYPPPEDAEGWGTRSFSKRGIAHVCVFHRAADWHQNDDFFDAMRACRAFLGPNIEVTAYGFSMGGYGAILGTPALRASRAVAVSPQSSIDPKAVRFERRYDAQWYAMGLWQHDLRKTISGDRAEYIVLFDPLHRLDRKHEARLPKPKGYTRCLIHGAGHAGLQTLTEMKIQEVLFDLLRGDASAVELRGAYRENRENSFRYLRKIGTRLHEKKHPKALSLFNLAQEKGFRRLVKKWRPFYA